MSPAFVIGHCVDFVDDDRPRGAQHSARLLGRHQDEQRFRRRDKDVRRLPAHLLALIHGCVAGTDGGANGRERHAPSFGEFANLRERNFEVLPDVVAQRLEWRHVNNAGFIGQVAGPGLANKLIQADQEGRESLAGAGRRGDEDIVSAADRGPAEQLRFGG